MLARARSHRRAVVVLLAVIGLIGTIVPAAAATNTGPTEPAGFAPAGPLDPPYYVTSTDDTDDGNCDVVHCSLREAIVAANANPGEDRIHLAGPTTISIDADLPMIDEAVTIEAIAGGPCCAPPVAYLDGPGSGTGLDLIGGASVIDGVVVGDFETGIRIRDGADGTAITNGGAGVAEFSSPAPNTADGIVVEASDVQIGPDGGMFSSDQVTVANSGGAGIVVTGSAERVRISRADIHDNGGLGIDIGPAGPNANDDDDLDSGPNGLQNAPVLTSVTTLGSMTQYEGTFEGAPNTSYDIEVFTVDACDPSGFGEGSASISTTGVFTDVNGEATFGGGIFAIGGSQALTATAIAPDGSTSEFSNCEANDLILQSDLNLALDDEVEIVGTGEGLRYTATVQNDGPTDATGVTFQQTLPAGATLEWAASSQGACSESAGTVTCSIGSLSASTFLNIATIRVDVTLNSAGAALTSASVTATEPDPDAGDNSANESTTVALPTPATFTVNSPNDANDGTCDGTHCSLREAIFASNINPGRDTIAFELVGAHLIQPTSALPLVTGPVVIDGTTDGDFAGSPVIEVAGNLAAGNYGIRIAGGDSEIRGLILNRWSNPALTLERRGENLVAGNWFGVDATGTTRLANNSAAIAVQSSGNTIGGTTAPDRNVASGSSSGIAIGRSTAGDPEPHDNVVQGNYVGLDASGTAAIFNFTGVGVGDSDDNLIGGTAPGAGNVISGNSQDGIRVSESSTGAHTEDNRVEGNIVGLNAAGTAAVPNQQGISVLLNADRTVIGGTAPGAGNTISGNSFDAVLVFSGAPDTLIAGNRIGTDPSGTTAFGNGRHGINLGPSNIRTSVGGTTAAHANVIAFNGQDGVQLNGTAAILGNSIHSNGNLGIDRLPNGVTVGAAGFRFPTLTSTVTHNGTTTVIGTLTSSPSTAFRIELFDNASCDASGNGEGQVFLTSTVVTTNGAGTAGFSVELASPLPIGRVVTATATTTGANPLNSEFSACSVNAAPAPDGTTGSGAAGTTTTTDPEADGATPADPIETVVTVPAGGVSGAVTISESTAAGPPPVGFAFFDLQVEITAPAQSAPQPLVLVFTIDETALPAGATATNVVVFRNAVAVPDCTSIDESATPDPCVFLREALAGGDLRLTVRTSSASTWNVGQSTGLPPYPFSGFFAPVDNQPTINRAKAGQAIPVKFSLGGDRGLTIFATGYPKSAVTSCNSAAPVDGIEETVNPGSATLTYDPVLDQYTYAWKTEKAWAGTCRQLVIQLTDGTFHRASFEFRR